MPSNRVDWWNQQGDESSSTGGFLSENELASCCVTTAKIAAGAVTANSLGSCAVETAKINAGAVTTAKITDANVVSCKLSTNALTRSIVIPFAKLASTEAGSLHTSDFIVYQPTVPINITAVQIVTLGTWENATCDELTFYRNSSSCVAQVGFKSIAASTALAAGNVSCVGVVTCSLIAANTVLTAKTNTSTCSVTADANIIIHYTTTA